MPQPELPFRMVVEDVFNAYPAGAVLCGEVVQGVVRIGDEVEAVGLRPVHRFTVSGLEQFRKRLTEARAGANIGVLVPGMRFGDFDRGQLLAAPGSVRTYTRLRATVCTQQPPGATLPLLFSPGSVVVGATVDLPPGVDAITPDVPFDATLTLNRPVVCEEGADFSVEIETRDPIRRLRRIGTGRIIETLD
ncbi:EF-Tu/IF-2/RF-3 family GTPase [Kitasatospora sp. NPDC048722]|uniref:EF-Tu/IF-2/RF-3 family GTPase n=1 Tax=Kitasatospora sp. NPDC048722 TaxID=3155639 RepID=UPI0033C79943